LKKKKKSAKPETIAETEENRPRSPKKTTTAPDGSLEVPSTSFLSNKEVEGLRLIL